jgi:hypothetical protein
VQQLSIRAFHDDGQRFFCAAHKIKRVLSYCARAWLFSTRRGNRGGWDRGWWHPGELRFNPLRLQILREYFSGQAMAVTFTSIHVTL